MRWPGIIETYRDFLPVTETTPVVSLQEGATPLVPAPLLAEKIAGNLSLFLKYEGLNPTGSFKDRGMTLAITKAKESGAKAVMCASTGNTSAAAAAYSARAGLQCIVLLPKGAIALGKLAQALIHGAQVIAVDGNFDQALAIAREITAAYPVTLVNSINPFRIEGQKTAAFEICDDLGAAPDFLAIPVGNAGNITAYWKGFQEYKQRGRSTSLPRLLGFQAAGSAPIVEGKIIEHPKTLATAIKIGNPASWKSAETALRESNGQIAKVTDDEIIEAYKLLAAAEGVFAEPASAASVAGVIKLGRAGFFQDIDGNVSVVCVLTGHGLKDPDRAIQCVREPVVVPPSVAAVVNELCLS
ncbi:MAG: threonine synthase [Candidatus Omnitrophica bacterium]|nr:threonine synthase [Candidatus Omnitrophota bacterium]